MVRIGKAQLKTGLEAQLEAVQRGVTVVVVDEDRPIAKLVPVERPTVNLVVQPAQGSLRDVPLLPPCDLPFDVVDILLEDRKDRL